LTDYADINWDAPNNIPSFLEILATVHELKNETVYSDFVAYTPGTAFAKFYHDGLHSQINGSDVSFPHSFVNHPIHSIPGDLNSDVVAYVMGGVAWDFALRFLLPEGVDGIIVEVESNFNHTRSYRLSGQDAFFLGDDAQHQPKYDHMKVMRSLLPPNARANNTQYQVCEYIIVSNFDTSFYNKTRHSSYSWSNFAPISFRKSTQARNLRHRIIQIHQGTSQSLLR
jgi:hypothetical protein